MSFKTLIRPRYGTSEWAGNCLPMAQTVVGAGGGPFSATEAANGTRFRHTSALPRDALAVVWLNHYGTYTDYRDGQLKSGNWGHVVIWDPSAFGGAGGFYSSPRNGFRPGEWFQTIAAVEAAFSSSYRFWSEDLNGVRVSMPTATPTKPPKPTIPIPAPQKGKTMIANPIGAYLGVTRPAKVTDERCVIFDPDSGFYTSFSGVDQKYINEQARLYGTKSFGRITVKHWNDIKVQLDEIRRAG